MDNDSVRGNGLVRSLKVELRPLEALKEAPRNARRHSEKQIGQIASSIRQFGFIDGRLAGYWVRENAQGVATARDVRPGSPRAALGGVELVEASFGVLADLDGVIAVLDEGQRKVTALYAGAVCIYD